MPLPLWWLPIHFCRLQLPYLQQWLSCPFIDVVLPWYLQSASATTTILTVTSSMVFGSVSCWQTLAELMLDINQMLCDEWLIFSLFPTEICCQQGHHHNGDWVARWPHIFCAIYVHSFEVLSKAVRLFTASLHSQPVCSQMCSINILVDLQPVDWNLKRGLFELTSLRD